MIHVSEQELANLLLNSTVAGTNYAVAQVGTTLITPSSASVQVVLAGILAIADADGTTFSLVDDSSAPVTLFPTTPLKAGTAVFIDGSKLPIAIGVAGKTIKLNCSAAGTFKVWAYEIGQG